MDREKPEILGPYKFEELLQEPDLEDETYQDSRAISIVKSKGVSLDSAVIEVTRKAFRGHISIFPDEPGTITMKSRYLLRRDGASPIEGVVTLEATYLLYGLHKGYTAASRQVISEIYVKPASQRQGIARILLAEVLSDAPNAMVSYKFSSDGARLFGFDASGKRLTPLGYTVQA